MGVWHILKGYDMRKVWRDIITVSLSLFRIMIPTLIVVKIATMLGFDDMLIYLCQPVMSWFTLPASASIVIVTTLLTNPYTGLIVAATLPEMAQLSVGQASLLALIMLFTHGLPLEAMISSRVGIRLWFVVLLRLGTAFLSALILAKLFQFFGWYQTPALAALHQLTGASNAPLDLSLGAWIVGQIGTLVIIQLVIIVLIAALELLRILGVEALSIWALSPLLRVMGIGKRGATIAIVGVTLGLSFGSGVLMKDVATATIPQRDVFGVMCFINLKHSLFEDTAILLLLGPSLFVIVILRLVCAVIITSLAMAFTSKMTGDQMRRYFTNHNIPRAAG